jgi:hypothetical protein
MQTKVKVKTRDIAYRLMSGTDRVFLLYAKPRNFCNNELDPTIFALSSRLELNPLSFFFIIFPTLFPVPPVLPVRPPPLWPSILPPP